jgi:hypothetical protein
MRAATTIKALLDEKDLTLLLVTTLDNRVSKRGHDHMRKEQGEN